MPVKNQVKGVKEAKTHRSKKKKKAVSHFFEDEADEDEDVIDVNDVEEDDDGVPDLEAIELEIANENMAKVDSEGAAR